MSQALPGRVQWQCELVLRSVFNMAFPPVSIVGDCSLPLLLANQPYHVGISIPFSLVVRDFDPATSPPLVLYHPRSPSWLTWLFGSRREEITLPFDKAMLVAGQPLRDLWAHVSTALFGREEAAVHAAYSSNAEDWARVNDSHLFWATFVGPVEGSDARVVVLKADGDLVNGAIQFTREEMDDEERESWYKATAEMPPLNLAEPSLSSVDKNIMWRNLEMRRWVSDLHSRQGVQEKRDFAGQ